MLEILKANVLIAYQQLEQYQLGIATVEVLCLQSPKSSASSAALLSAQKVKLPFRVKAVASMSHRS